MQREVDEPGGDTPSMEVFERKQHLFQKILENRAGVVRTNIKSVMSTVCKRSTQTLNKYYRREHNHAFVVRIFLKFSIIRVPNI